jgi:hypothetical protein
MRKRYKTGGMTKEQPTRPDDPMADLIALLDQRGRLHTIRETVCLECLITQQAAVVHRYAAHAAVTTIKTLFAGRT